MPWGALREQSMIVLLRLRGSQLYAQQMAQASAATGRLVGATEAQALAAERVAKRTWLQNQALFTARRYAFYTTLAITALAASVAKLGFNYLTAMQESRAALLPMLQGTGQLETVMNRLWTLAA